MNERCLDWDNLKLFLAVARAGGLGPAAARTGKSPPTLGRRMVELERDLGRDLFVRKPRGYSLTQEGEGLLVKAESMEALVQPLLATSPAEAPPLVKIAAGTWVTQVLLQAVDQLLATAPVRLRFIAEESLTDIARREAVIGVRNRAPVQVGLAGRKIGGVQFAVYARDPSVTPWARVLNETPSALWVRRMSQGAPAIEVSAPHHALTLAKAGLARAVLPTFIGNQQAGLRPVSDPIHALNHDQWLVAHHEDRFLPEIRKLMTYLHALLQQTCADARYV